MKCPIYYNKLEGGVVVPHEGTWIEIWNSSEISHQIESFPTRERGLKFHRQSKAGRDYLVVPHEGTWIEIILFLDDLNIDTVVPHEGTWIEIRETLDNGRILCVVPHEGTWIEISRLPARSRSLSRRSPRGNVD